MRILSYFTIVMLATVMAACTGEPPGFVDDDNTGGGTDPGGGGTPTIPDDTVRIGSGTGTNFQAGVIAVSQTNLQAGGSASLTVTFVDSNNVLVGDSITVGFSSPCAAGGLATIVEPSVTTVTGAATATYSAIGCAGSDPITATANVDGFVLSATASITVAAASVGSIEFVSANPTNIGLLGTGGVGRQETSTVRFRVTDSTGGPVAGSTVDFSLNTTVGGIMLTPTTATSDVQGFIQTVVSAGSVATSVRVTATVISVTPVIATQSDQLTITTGIPDNDSVSLSTACVNVEGWNIDGITSQTTIRMADRYNNPVPDGTAVTFTAEGGQIGGSCQTATFPTEAGVCSVSWVTQAPRPPNGRVSILATAIGEESFTDVDSNGRFNGTDFEAPIGEPYRDDNENMVYDVNEVFSDFNSNGARDDEVQADYLGFNGLLCDVATGNCNPNETLFVSDDIVIVMSSSNASIFDNVGGAITVPPASGAAVTFTLTIGDNKGNGTTIQPMAGGTSVSVDTSNGAIVGPSSYNFPCSAFDGPFNIPFTVEGDTTSDGGVISIAVTSPSGIVTTHSISFSD